MGWILPTHHFFGVDSNFRLLTPTEDAQDIEPYKNALTFALQKKNQGVRNIAVTGLYGAGKSSFLKTYFKGCDNVLWVSLALFLEADGSGRTESDEQEFEHRLELSILQQIFHVQKESWWPSILLVLAVGVVTSGILCLNHPGWLVKSLPKALYDFCLDWRVGLFGLITVVLVLVAGTMAVFLANWVRHLGVKSVGVSGGIGSVEIEMPDDLKNCSVINRNIRAIISYFASSDCQIVIFEDIDRFNDVQIFTKLRELNTLLNNSRQISQKKKPIRFVYALREELFKDEKERTKFFEFIIPIIPRINASNSHTELLSFLNEYHGVGLDEDCKKLVKDISPYISDMRLLNNICNEFYIYHQQIIDCTSQSELLGLIVFKNFFPKDFALMHRGEGVVQLMMDAKRQVQEDLLGAIDQSIAKIAGQIERIKNELLAFEENLRDIYFVGLLRELRRKGQQILLAGEWVRAIDIVQHKEWLDEIKKRPIETDYGNSISWVEVQNSVDKTISFEERLQYIEGKHNGRIESLRKNIDELRAKKLLVRRKTIFELIASGDMTEMMLSKTVLAACKERKDKELLYELISKGYLNEKYPYNISVFREVDGVSSIQDYYFELRVNKGECSDWNEPLKKPQELIDKLPVRLFSTAAIMNYGICRELLKNNPCEKSDEFLRLIAKVSRSTCEFVDGYLNQLATQAEAIEFFESILTVNSHYVDELVCLYDKENVWPCEFVDRQIGLYIACVMKGDSDCKIGEAVRSYIENCPRIPTIMENRGLCTEEAYNNFVDRFKISFGALDCDKARATGLLSVIVAKRAYAFVPSLLCDLLKYMGVDVSDFEKRSLSVIRGCGHRSIIDYVAEEFECYLHNVYLKSIEVQEDTVEAVLGVVNRDDISEEDKKLFLGKQWQNSRIVEANQVASIHALNLCIDENRIVPSWSNAVEIWNRNKDDKTPFWKYANRKECYTQLSIKNSRRVEWSEDEGWAKKFAECEQLSDEAVMGLLSGMRRGVISKYTGANATPYRILKLSKVGRLCYSNLLFKNLKAIGNDSHIMFAVLFVKEFCSEYEDGLVDAEDAKKLLGCDQLNRRHRPLLLNTLHEIIIEDENLSAAAAECVDEGDYCDVDERVLDAVFFALTPVSLQCKVIQRLGGDSQIVRERLSRMCEPYSKLSKLGHRPELLWWEGLGEFLDFLAKAGVVSSVDSVKDGRVHVNTTRS